MKTTQSKKCQWIKKLIVFDLDGTLAESKSSIDSEMSMLIRALLEVVQVAVISGGDWPQFEQQLLSSLPQGKFLERLYLLPTSGTKFYRYGLDWKKLYSDDFTAAEKEKIISSLEKAITLSGRKAERVWGEVIEDRGSQITLSALGQQAPLEEKMKWDPDFSKRKQIMAYLEALLPEFSVRLGGTTSVDVTKLGIDKAYAIKQLRNLLGVTYKEMLFIGDALFPGGNDYPVRETGVACIKVLNSNETKRAIENIIDCFYGIPEIKFGWEPYEEDCCETCVTF